MDRLDGGIGSYESQDGVLPGTETNGDVAEVSIDREAEGCEQLLVERATTKNVGNWQVEMIEIDHGPAAAA